MNTAELVSAQRAFFDTGATRPVSFRKEMLRRLRRAILEREAEILAAAKADLGKSDFEAFATEVYLVLGEIGLMLRKVGAWARPQNRYPGLFNLPGKAVLHRDPHGVCLVMSPWNYPFQLSVMPLVGAIAAGNTAVLKPSAYSKATSALVARMINETFPAEYLHAIEGGRDVNADLLSQRFDYIFFTGSVSVGKVVMEAAAKHLTPVTLELGGKSPCIVDETADVALAAKRAAWGKCLNSGQTCVAPDYFLVHERVKEAFVAELRAAIRSFFGDEPHRNEEYPRMINEHHFRRILGLIEGERETPGRSVTGGREDAATLRIEPAIIENAGWDDPVMEEELFGPIIPVIPWTDEEDVTNRILARPRPLALYLFTRNKAQKRRVFSRVPFGGGCLNDTVMHVATHAVPFGGTGASGMGGYHGKASFDTFSRSKPVIERALFADNPLRYAPFGKKYGLFRKFL